MSGRGTARVGEPLTPREIAAVKLAALSNKRIGDRLTPPISEHTVKMHVNNAIVKLGVDSRAGAIVAALRQGVISLAEVVTS